MSSRTATDAELRVVLPRLRRFARWLTRDASRADDLVQSTLERALLRWHTRRDGTALRAWLYAIAYRLFLDDRRRARRRTAALELFGRSVEPVEPSLERSAVARSVIEALEKLPEAQRYLLLLISVDGLSYQETATLLDIPVGTVMSRLSRARAALRRVVDGEASEAPVLRVLK